MTIAPAPTLYKFLNSEHVDFVLVQKTLKISSSDYFRRQYEAMPIKNDFINDPDEGRSYWHQSTPFELENATDLERQAAAIMLGSMSIPASSSTTFSNNSIVTFVPSFHMISFAEGPLEDAAAALCVPMEGIDRPYDACLEIADIDALMSDVLNAGKIIGEEGASMPFGHLFSRVIVNPVRYETVAADFGSPQPIADPFLKGRAFSAQREVRGVFEQRGNSRIDDTLIVHVETLDKHIRRVDLPTIKATAN